VSDLEWLVIFGGAAIVIFTGIYIWRHPLNITFARLYGLLVIAVLGVFMAFAEGLQDEARTAGFTLLGTIAGYLVGARPTEATEVDREGGQVTATVL
jgi:hypothetical protein